MVCNHGFWRERTLVIDVLATPETSHWGNSGDTDYPKLIKMVKSREMLPQYIDDVKGLCPNKNIKELTFGRPAREMRRWPPGVFNHWHLKLIQTCVR